MSTKDGAKVGKRQHIKGREKMGDGKLEDRFAWT